MHEFASALFDECTSYGNGIFFAAQDNNTVTLKGILSTLKSDPNKLDSEGRTALSISILSSANNATVTLLEFNADPNIPVKLHGYTQKKKIIQFCINNNDISTIQLLGIYGASMSDIIIPDGSTTARNVFEEAIKKKQNIERHRTRASLALQGAIPNYNSALNDFQSAGDIWWDIAQVEKKTAYKKHYYEKAFQYYQQAEQCFNSLSQVLIQSNSKNHRQLFERLADIANQLNKHEKAAAYSQHAAQLTSSSFCRNMSQPTFPYSKEKKIQAEQKPLLSDSSSQTITISKATHLKSV